MLNEPTTSPEPSPLEKKRAFLRLPIEERRKILERQAQELAAHYTQNDEWRDTAGLGIIDYEHDTQS